MVEDAPKAPAPSDGARLPAYRQLDLRITKQLAVKGLGLTAYLDVRNLSDLSDALLVFSTTGHLANAADRQNRGPTTALTMPPEAKASGVYGPRGWWTCDSRALSRRGARGG